LIDSIAAWRAGHRLPQDIDQSQKFTSTSAVIDSIGLMRCQKRWHLCDIYTSRSAISEPDSWSESN